VTLRSADPHEVPIHCCPECGGVWLEHQTIHKILERSRAGIQAVLVGKRPTGRVTVTPEGFAAANERSESRNWSCVHAVHGIDTACTGEAAPHHFGERAPVRPGIAATDFEKVGLETGGAFDVVGGAGPFAM
jgi:Zn-finger nucleic acid-binding protein